MKKLLQTFCALNMVAMSLHSFNAAYAQETSSGDELERIMSELPTVDANIDFDDLAQPVTKLTVGYRGCNDASDAEINKGQARVQAALDKILGHRFNPMFDVLAVCISPARANAIPSYSERITNKDGSTGRVLYISLSATQLQLERALLRSFYASTVKPLAGLVFTFIAYGNVSLQEYLNGMARYEKVFNKIIQENGSIRVATRVYLTDGISNTDAGYRVGEHTYYFWPDPTPNGLDVPVTLSEIELKNLLLKE